MKLGEALSLKSEMTKGLGTKIYAARSNLSYGVDASGNDLDPSINHTEALDTYLDSLQALTKLGVDINITNSVTSVTHNGSSWSLTAIIARRAQCLALSSFYTDIAMRLPQAPKAGAIEKEVRASIFGDPMAVAKAKSESLDLESAVATAVGVATQVMPIMPLDEAIKLRDSFAKEARELDTKIQQINWATDLVAS